MSAKGENGIPIYPSQSPLLAPSKCLTSMRTASPRKQFINALDKMYIEEKIIEQSWEREVDKNTLKQNYNFDSFQSRVGCTMDKIHEEQGSWETRKNYIPASLLRRLHELKDKTRRCNVDSGMIRIFLLR